MLAFQVAFSGAPWPRHTIDNTSRGADGVKLMDVDTDGRHDVVTGWEQGGVVRVYLFPSRVDSRRQWRQVTVGAVPSAEDAQFVDVDGDGWIDVVSACEGKTRSLFVHWAPNDPDRYWDSAAWKTEPIPAAKDLMQWMFAVPLQVDSRHGTDLVAGAKGPDAAIGWLRAPAKPRDLAAWTWHPLRPAGWIMSIITADMDGDRDQDILFSDRRGARSGVYWLENPGSAADQTKPWTEHPVGSQDREVMFIDYTDFDGDGLRDVLAAVRPNEIHFHKRGSADGQRWSPTVIPIHANAGIAKAVRAVDLNLDTKLDLLVSNEGAKGDKRGVYYLTQDESGAWRPVDISGPEGVKFDLVELADFDGDGDPDVVTTEEVDQLGVIWYENPGRY